MKKQILSRRRQTLSLLFKRNLLSSIAIWQPIMIITKTIIEMAERTDGLKRMEKIEN